jgi:hypothetical protein
VADQLIAVIGFAYPADAESLRLVREAGGLSKLTKSQRGKAKYKRVEPGEDCSDMPAESVAVYLSRGEVTRVDTPTRKRKTGEA